MTEKKKKPEKPEGKLQSSSIHVVATFNAPLLGTAPGNPDIYEEFIGSRSADKERIKEELLSLPVEKLEEKGKTVFHRNDDGLPILYDYQIKGFIKEFFKVLTEFGEIRLPYGQKISKYTVIRIVDNFIYVFPREIPLVLPKDGEITQCVRPLRASTMKGERVSLACSEQSPKGTVIRFAVEWLNPALEKYVLAALNYGAKKGIGQWRNSGMGRFRWAKAE